MIGDPSERGSNARAGSPRWRSELGVAPAPLAIAWCLRNPHVSTVMLGATRSEQLLQNLEALDLGERFDDDVWQRVEAATT